MIRIRENILKKELNKYYLNNTLFTGIIFYVLDCNVYDKKTCVEGEITNTYKNDFIDSKNYIEINFDCLEGDDPYYPEYQFYKNDKFTGIAYGFNNNGFCTDEMLYLKGRNDPVISMDFSLSGQLTSFDSDADELSQVFEWFENKKIKFISLVLDNIRFSISFNETGEIITLYIDKEYFENIKEIQKKSKFKIFNERFFLKNITASNHLNLSGGGVDDEILYYLQLNNGLKKTNNIIVNNTSLTKKNLQKILKLNN